MKDKDWIDVLAESSGADAKTIQALRDNLRQAEVHREEARTCDANANAIVSILRLQTEQKAMNRMMQGMVEGMAKGFEKR